MEHERKTLLLYSTLEPCAIVSWKDAIIKFLTKKGEILHSHGWIVHPHVDGAPLRAPSVLRLNFNGSKRYARSPRLTRTNVFLRDNYMCQYCGKNGAKKELTCDHVIPKSKGGTLSWENIVTACHECNRKKSNKTLNECKLTLKRIPKRPSSLYLFVDNDIPQEWKFYIKRN